MISLQQLDMSLPSSVISLSPFHPPLLSFFPLSLCVFMCMVARGERERRKWEGDREVEAENSFCIFFIYKYALYLVFQGKISPSLIILIYKVTYWNIFFFLMGTSVLKVICNSFLVLVFNVIVFMEVKQNTNWLQFSETILLILLNLNWIFHFDTSALPVTVILLFPLDKYHKDVSFGRRFNLAYIMVQ